LDLIEGANAIDQQGSPNSTHFFQNSHHIIISGGTFTGSNLVVHDPVVRDQYQKILKVVYIQLGVLFVERVTIDQPKIIDGDEDFSVILWFCLIVCPRSADWQPQSAERGLIVPLP